MKYVNTILKKYQDQCNINGHTKEKCWKLHPELQPKRTKPQDEYSKKKGKTVLNVKEVEELLKLEQTNAKLSLMVRKLETIMNANPKA